MSLLFTNQSGLCLSANECFYDSFLTSALIEKKVAEFLFNYVIMYPILIFTLVIYIQLTRQ